MAADNVTPLIGSRGVPFAGSPSLDAQNACPATQGDGASPDPFQAVKRFVAFNPTADDYNVPGGGPSATVFLDSHASSQALVLLAGSRATRLRALLDLFASSSCDRGVELSELGMMLLPHADELCTVLQMLEARSERWEPQASTASAVVQSSDPQ